MPFPLVLALFFVSGGSGLVYEVLWTRRLTLIFGSGLFATSTILATFMGGLALGAWLLGKTSDRQENPLAFYGWLEIGVGLYALALPLLISVALPLYQWAYRTWDGAAIPVNLSRFALSAAIFLLPSFLMGGTLPALSRFVLRDRSGVGERVGSLYAINTWGAVAGCLLAGFLLIELLGLRGAEMATAITNVAVGIAAITLGRMRASASLLAQAGRRIPSSDLSPSASSSALPASGNALNAPSSPLPASLDILSSHSPALPVEENALCPSEETLSATPGPAAASVTAPSPTSGDAVSRGLVLAVICLSGFAALGYEVIWTRYLSFYLGNSTYAFSLMLAAFLVGLASGAVVASRRVDRLKDPFKAFAWAELLVGASMAAGVALYVRLPDVHAGIQAWVPGESWAERVSIRFGAGFVILLVPTFFLGVIFPLAGRLYVHSRARIGAQVGFLYAVNTLGAIMGSVCGGFLLIPLLGFRDSAVFLVCVNALLALALSLRALRGALLLRLGAAMLAAIAILGLPRQVFLQTIRRAFPGEEIVYYRENPSATVFVTRSAEDERWVHFSDQRGSGGTHNLPGHRFWGHLPSILSDRRGSACVICFGSGITLGSVARHPFKRIVCAELCERIHEPARWFPENHGVLDDPRVRLVTDDGRNVLLGTGEQFDVIVSEPPLLETAGVVNLFTKEFYEIVRARLAPGGVFCQWVPSGEFTRQQRELVLRTFQSVFPHATFWGSPIYYDTVLIGTLGPQRYDLAEISRRVAEPAVRADLMESGIDGPLELLGYFALSGDGLRRYCGSGPIMTDDRTVLDFEMPRTVHRLLGLRQVTYWKRKMGIPIDLLDMQGMESVAPWVLWPRDEEQSRAGQERLTSIERAKRLVLAGHRAAQEGNEAERIRLYDEGRAAAPGFTTARYYAALARIEHAETAASSGNRVVAGRLADEAGTMAHGFPHLTPRIALLRDGGRVGSTGAVSEASTPRGPRVTSPIGEAVPARRP